MPVTQGDKDEVDATAAVEEVCVDPRRVVRAGEMDVGRLARLHHAPKRAARKPGRNLYAVLSVADLHRLVGCPCHGAAENFGMVSQQVEGDRKRGVEGKSVAGRVDLGGRGVRSTKNSKHRSAP